MTILYIKILHVLGAFCLFAGFGGLLAIGENRTTINRIVASLHGAGLLILFLSGFAMVGMNKAIEGFPAWVLVKMGLWVAMALVFVFIKRGKLPAFPGIVLSLLLGALTVYLCLFKPF